MERLPTGRTLRFVRRGFVPLSVVVRASDSPGAPETLEACRALAGGCELELLVTPEGAGEEARNRAAQAARYDHLLFLGPELQPASEDFFRVHASLHSAHPETDFAVMGGVTWPGRNDTGVLLSPGYLLGRGQPHDPEPAPFTFLDYRYLSDSNFSVKKSVVRDWIAEGFRPEFSAALGGVELAWRLSRRPPGLRILYDPTALACHRRRWSLADAMERQRVVGGLLRRLVDQHPEMAEDFDLPAGIEGERDLDYAAILEGVQAWARILDSGAGPGSQPWRRDFQSVALEVCLLHGFVSAEPGGGVPAGAGARILERFWRRLRQSLHAELATPAVRG